MSIKTKRKKFNITAKRLIIFIAIVCFMALTFIFNAKIEKLLGINNSFYKTIVNDDYVVHFVDVGQGDCTIIEFPNDEIMIIDSGDKESETQLEKYLDKVIFKNKEKTIDYLMATHSDSDHIGNMEYLLHNYEVKNVYRPDVYSKSESVPTGKNTCNTIVYDNFIKALKNENGCDVKTFGNYQQELIRNSNNEVVAICSMFRPSGDIFSEMNDYSPFILIDCNESKILFTGDASAEIEHEILTDPSFAEVIPDDIDIYQCGHHGSKYSTSQELLDATNPDICIISCDENNSYGHPHSETISKLNHSNVETHITATEGNIVYSYSDEGDVNFKNGEFNSLDEVHWWMIVLVVDGVSAIIIFSIKVKFRKKL